MRLPISTKHDFKSHRGFNFHTPPPTSLLLKLHCVRSYSSLFIHNSFLCILNLNFWSKNIINLSPISLSNSQIIKQPWKLGDQHEIWNSVSQCYSKSKQPKKIRSQKKKKKSVFLHDSKCNHYDLKYFWTKYELGSMYTAREIN